MNLSIQMARVVDDHILVVCIQKYFDSDTLGIQPIINDTTNKVVCLSDLVGDANLYV